MVDTIPEGYIVVKPEVWDDLVQQLGDARADAQSARAEVSRLKKAMNEAAVELTCYCDEAYTKRGRHEPNALCYVGDDLRTAVAGAALRVSQPEGVASRRSEATASDPEKGG